MPRAIKTDVYVIDFVNKKRVLTVSFLNNNSKADKESLSKVHEHVNLVTEIKVGREIAEVQTPAAASSNDKVA